MRTHFAKSVVLSILVLSSCIDLFASKIFSRPQNNQFKGKQLDEEFAIDFGKGNDDDNGTTQPPVTSRRYGVPVDDGGYGRPPEGYPRYSPPQEQTPGQYKSVGKGSDGRTAYGKDAPAPLTQGSPSTSRFPGAIWPSSSAQRKPLNG
jgi:hypothetical protein